VAADRDLEPDRDRDRDPDRDPDRDLRSWLLVGPRALAPWPADRPKGQKGVTRTNQAGAPHPGERGEPQGDPDADLVEQARRGDVGALGRLLVRHRRPSQALALRILRNEADADDAVQDACLAVVERLDQFRGDAAFATWMRRVLANQCLMRLRSRRCTRDPVGCPAHRVLCLDEQGGPDLDVPSGAPPPDLVAEQRQRLRAIERAIARLEGTCRQAFLLNVLDEVPLEQTAEALAVSVPAVKTRVHRARRALEAYLQEAPHPAPAA
jgi:RNA polymerase sigma-70 factor (ECF subfamily)